MTSSPPPRPSAAFPPPDPLQREINAFVEAARNDNLTDVQAFLSKHPTLINAYDRVGRSALHAAAAGGHKQILDLLLQKGVPLDFRSKYNWTPLIEAAQNGRTEMVDYLLQKGAEIDTTAQEGWTALMWASRMGHEKTVELLLERGAVAETKNIHGKTAAELAHQYPEVIEVLEQWSAERKSEKLRAAKAVEEAKQKSVEADKKRLETLKNKRPRKGPFGRGK